MLRMYARETYRNSSLSFTNIYLQAHRPHNDLNFNINYTSQTNTHIQLERSLLNENPGSDGTCVKFHVSRNIITGTV